MRFGFSRKSLKSVFLQSIIIARLSILDFFEGPGCYACGLLIRKCLKILWFVEWELVTVKTFMFYFECVKDRTKNVILILYFCLFCLFLNSVGYASFTTFNATIFHALLFLELHKIVSRCDKIFDHLNLLINLKSSFQVSICCSKNVLIRWLQVRKKSCKTIYFLVF